MSPKFFLIVISLLFTLTIFIGAKPNEKNEMVNNTLSNIFKLWNTTIPEDRIYVQSDKPFYAPGETIWFTAFVRDGRTLKSSTKSDIVYAELINPKGSIEKKLTLIAENGLAKGDFKLDLEIPGGLYTLKAFTNWQKNDPDPAYFIKEIQVQDIVLPRLKMKVEFAKKAYGADDKVTANLLIETNENKPLSDMNINYTASIAGNQIFSEKSKTDNDGKVKITFQLPAKLLSNDGLLNILCEYDGQTESISRSIPIVLNKIALNFYPEGGDLVTGLKSNVAFKAVNEFGKGADIEGYITDNKSNKIVAFQSYHMGMGAFTFTPQEGTRYSAHIRKPSGITETFDIPDAMPQGYVLSIKEASHSELKLSINSTREEALKIFIQIRGVEYYSNTFKAHKGNNEIAVALGNYPVGVAQITLFDSRGIERAERLVFVNKYKQLSVAISTDKAHYLPREKVKMTITATDETGMRMPGHFALAVTNDQLLSFADDKSSTILTTILAEADVKGKIEEPRFYFDAKESKADKALDYLLMTQGWRRFTWQQISENEMPQVSYQSERAVISGCIMSSETNKGVADAEISIMNENVKTKTDKDGYFTINNIDLSSQKILIAKKGKYHEELTLTNYRSDIELWFNNRHIPMPRAAKMAGMAAPMPANAQVELMNRLDELENAKCLLFKKIIPEDNIFPKKQEFIANNLKQVAEKKAKQQARIMKKELARPQFAMMDEAFMPEPVPANNISYYRARVFSIPDYKEPNVSERTDFRSTIYWNGDVELKNNGTATVEFYTSDEITSFRAVTEGFTFDGGIGRGENVFFTKSPFTLSAKLPPVALTGDTIELSLLIKNTTQKAIAGELSINMPKGLIKLSSFNSSISIPANNSKVVPIILLVENCNDSAIIGFSFVSQGLSDAFSKAIKIQSQGFPVELSFSGNELKGDYVAKIVNPVKNSVKATFRAYPSVVSDLLQGIESILQEPYGCFEQTSTSSYPNALVLAYMKSSDTKDQPTIDKANELLVKGYKRLTTFETKDKGYEWFGHTPGHEALTAYGLMQFNDMKKTSSIVDQSMIDRTSNWLLSRRDGKGGFLRNPQSLDSYGAADQDITNAYIVYALAEAGRRDMQPELNASLKAARETNDPYTMALVCNALYYYEDKNNADELLKRIISKQSQDGSWCGTRHSITRSEGMSLKLETTSLVCMAIMNSKQNDMSSLTKGIKFIVGSRSGNGGFGSTQSTIMSLKALTKYAVFARKTDSPGTIVILVNGSEVAKKTYEAGERNAIEISSLERFLSNDSTTISVRFSDTKNALPYSISVDYYTWQPSSSENCKVQLSTTMGAANIKTGQTVRITTVLTNKTDTGLPMTLAIVGLPAGLSAQPWQLKELQEKKVIDFYEITGSSVVFYYRQMKPSEVKTINLDCKAEIAGIYKAPASRAYLYYTDEFKTWTSLNSLQIGQ
jgi:hypothetical protein